MNRPDALIAALPGISLDDLNARAALLRRTDRKYVLTEAQFCELLHQLGDDVRALEIDGNRKPNYESLYFDTVEHDSYRSTAHRRRHRFKVRTRSYLDSQQCYLEIKLRDARRRTVKLRCEYPFDHRDAIDAKGRTFIASTFGENGIDAALADRLMPVLHTHFRRTTLFVPSAGCRVTVDTDLTFSHDDETLVVADELILLETKSDAQDQRVDRLLWRMGARPQKVSKFAIGRALLDPTLPDNKWSRTIARHFATASR